MANSQSSSKKRTHPRQMGAIGFFDLYGDMGRDYMSELQSTQGLVNYNKMRWNDPVVGGLLLRMEQLFSSVTWSIEDETYLSLTTIQNVIREMTSAFTFGFYVGEIIYKMQNDVVVVNDIAPRGQISIWNIVAPDDVYQLNMGYKIGIHQYGVKGVIPYNKCVHLRILTPTRWKFGKSLLRHIYKPYYYKKSIEAAEAVGADRDLAGLPVLTAPEGFDFTAAQEGNPNYSELAASTLDWAEEVVSSIRKDEQEGIVLPFGWNLELLRGQQSSIKTDEIIKRYNTEMCVGLLENFVSEGAFSSATRNSSQTHSDIFMASCESWAKLFETTLNEQVLKRVATYNAMKDYPKITHSPINHDNLKDLASYVSRLISQGAITPDARLETMLREIGNLPKEEV